MPETLSKTDRQLIRLCMENQLNLYQCAIKSERKFSKSAILRQHYEPKIVRLLELIKRFQ